MAADGDRRAFRLPHQPHSLILQEDTFGACGFGHRVWEAGVALAIWLSLNPSIIKGQRVLELGSGVGIGGIAAALQQPQSVTLSDIAGRRHHRCLKIYEPTQPPITSPPPPERSIGTSVWMTETLLQRAICTMSCSADCIYYPSDAAALAARPQRHLRPDGGVAVLFNRVGRESDPAEAFEALRELSMGNIETEELVSCPTMALRRCSA